MESEIRKQLHSLLDRLIDDSETHGVFEYISEQEIVKTPDPHIPSIWKFNRTRMEMTLKIRKEIEYV